MSASLGQCKQGDDTESYSGNLISRLARQQYSLEEKHVEKQLEDQVEEHLELETKRQGILEWFRKEIMMEMPRYDGC